MKLDANKIDQAVLALLLLGRHDVDRAWKGFDWEAMNRLFEKGLRDTWAATHGYSIRK